MNALELCQRKVVTVRRNEELGVAARMMRERHVGCLVVVEPAGAMGGQRPIGMLTDRDIVTHVVAREAQLRDARVEDAMSRHPVTLPTLATLEDALQRMRENHVRRVPLVDGHGRLAGILALDDIVEHLANRPAPSVTPMRRNRTRRE